MGELQDNKLLSNEAVKIITAVDKDGNPIFNGTDNGSLDPRKWADGTANFSTDNVQVVLIVDKDGNPIG